MQFNELVPALQAQGNHPEQETKSLNSSTLESGTAGFKQTLEKVSRPRKDEPEEKIDTPVQEETREEVDLVEDPSIIAVSLAAPVSTEGALKSGEEQPPHPEQPGPAIETGNSQINWEILEKGDSPAEGDPAISQEPDALIDPASMETQRSGWAEELEGMFPVEKEENQGVSKEDLRELIENKSISKSGENAPEGAALESEAAEKGQNDSHERKELLKGQTNHQSQLRAAEEKPEGKVMLYKPKDPPSQEKADQSNPTPDQEAAGGKAANRVRSKSRGTAGSKNQPESVQSGLFGEMAGVRGLYQASGEGIKSSPLNLISRTVIEMAEGQQTQIHLQLKPQSLGGLKIELVQAEEGLHVQIQADAAPTAQLLNQHLNELKTALSQTGIQLSSLSVGHDDSNQQASQGQGNQANPIRNREKQQMTNPEEHSLASLTGGTSLVEYRV